MINYVHVEKQIANHAQAYYYFINIFTGVTVTTHYNLTGRLCNNIMFILLFLVGIYCVDPIEYNALCNISNDLPLLNTLGTAPWCTSPEPCFWFGIYCVNNHIHDITLSIPGLVGSISTQIGLLTY